MRDDSNPAYFFHFTQLFLCVSSSQNKNIWGNKWISFSETPCVSPESELVISHSLCYLFLLLWLDKNYVKLKLTSRKRCVIWIFPKDSIHYTGIPRKLRILQNCRWLLSPHSSRINVCHIFFSCNYFISANLLVSYSFFGVVFLKIPTIIENRKFVHFFLVLQDKGKFFSEDIMLLFRSPIFANILLSLCTEKCSEAVKCLQILAIWQAT